MKATLKLLLVPKATEVSWKTLPPPNAPGERIFSMLRVDWGQRTAAES